EAQAAADHGEVERRMDERAAPLPATGLGPGDGHGGGAHRATVPGLAGEADAAAAAIARSRFARMSGVGPSRSAVSNTSAASRGRPPSARAIPRLLWMAAERGSSWTASRRTATASA